MDWQDLFRSGKLLLPLQPSETAQAVTQPASPLAAELLLVLFVVLCILQLQRFLQLFPYLYDSIFRARGSARLENSIRISHDRNILALTFILPALLLMYRYKLYSPAFLEGLEPNLLLLALAGILLAYLFLRLLLFLLLTPRAHQDIYRQSHRVGYTCFILLMLLVLPTVGILSLLQSNDLVIRNFILWETAIAYILFLVRKAQILAQFCNPLRTFLYLCALEFVPTTLFVLSAILL